jgi:VanZ family protein
MRWRPPATDSGTRLFVRLPTLTLAFMVAVLAFLAYSPFAWDPPHIARNDVTRTREGNLRFGAQNYARSDGSPEWLGAVQKAGHLTINLEALPYFPQRHAPVSIMMLAQDFWHTSFAIGQDDANLMLWLKRPGSTDNGDPPFTIPEVFRPNHWTRVQVEIAGMRLRVIVDGKVKLDERLSPGTLSSWHGGQVALGDEVHGGKGWGGEIRRAEVTTTGTTVDYVRSDALRVPSSYLYLPDHVAPFPPPSASEWLALGLHLLSFIVVGLLVLWARRPRRPVVGVLSATILASGIAVLLAVGKFCFHGRHTSAGDLLSQILGALIGAILGWLALRRRGQVLAGE